MELVYLWVEEYKNIHRQGFNFSPKFDCKYDPDTNELTIDENDDYIENFFGENINVTAIVGKNGSGKSSVLELIYLIGNQKFTKKVFFIFIDIKNKLIIKSDKNLIIKPQNSYQIKIYEQNILLKDEINYIDVSHFKNDIFKNSTINTINDFKYQLQGAVSSSSDYEDILYDSHKLFKTFQIYSQLVMLNNKEVAKYIIELFQIPKPIYIKVSLADDYSDENSLEEKLDSDNEIINKFIECGEYVDDKFIINIKYKEEINNFLNLLYDDIDCCLYICFLDKNYNEIYFSSGEQIILYYLGIFFHISNKIKYIVIDEIDLYLHPSWQKKILNTIITFLRLKKRIFNVILTSHSPFLLSDIPKQNIIFLDKDENGNCKVVDGLKEKKQTFGANIHTLLSDSFFMDDGLMGEFAKGKINEIIEFHKEVEKNKKEKSNCFSLRRRYLRLKTKFWQTQSIIGEEYLKQVMKNHLVEIEKILLGKDRAKIEEITRTEVYLESLKND